MTAFAEFIRRKTDVRGEQARMARRLNLSPTTITNWKSGASPDFESCMLVAEYFSLDPVEVFQMAERPELERVFRKFFPEYEARRRTEEDLYPLEHCRWHQMLEWILENCRDSDLEAQQIKTSIQIAFRDVCQEKGRPDWSEDK